MKVLHISTATSGGGAARIARTLHARQRALGISSTLLCGRGEEDAAEAVFTLGVGRGRLLGNVLLQRLTGQEGVLNEGAWEAAFARFVDVADVIHLHNAHGYYLSHEILERINRRPLLWSLKDEWLMTGRCAFPLECQDYLKQCAPCPHLRRYPAAWLDRAGVEFVKRRQLVERSGALFVTPSEMTRSRFIAAGFPADRLQVIPNPLRLESDYPAGGKAWAKRVLGLPEDKIVALFVAAQAWNSRKGLDVVAAATRGLTRPEDWSLCVVGEVNPEVNRRFNDHPVEVRFEGRVEERERLALYYLASDVLIAPSQWETFGNIVLEAAAMGCRVACTDLPVFREILQERAEYFDVGDSQGCAKILDAFSEEGCPELPVDDVHELRERFAPDRIARAYLGCYEKVLQDFERV